MMVLLKNFLNSYRTELEGLFYGIRSSKQVSQLALREQVAHQEPQAPIRRIAAHYDLNITKRISDIDGDIDVLRSSVPSFFSELAAYCRQHKLCVHLRTGDGKWRDVSGKRLAKWLGSLALNQPTEIAITCMRCELLLRLSLNVWRRAGDALVSTVADAPAKKLLHKKMDVRPREDLRTDRCIEGIDVVYTWVNAEDPAWQADFRQYRSLDTIDLDRFQQVDELKYSLRSLFTYAPWVGTIYIFSNCAPPEWFKASEKIKWVRHQDVVAPERLPLFNSHAIETYLHLIPGLSERYIYFNDDVFLAAPVRPTDFFTAYGQSVSRMEPYGMSAYLGDLAKADMAQDWHYAAVNASKLLYQQNKILPTSLHHHAPFAILKSVYQEMITRYAAEADETGRAKFRSKTDHSFTSFMYHHFALSQGKAQHINEASYIVKSSNFMQFYAGQNGRKSRFFCINDGGGSATNPRFIAFKQWYLDKRFPFRSPAEK